MSGVTKGASDEIVISGMSGRFPESDCLEELWDNLMAKVDMIKVDDRRWPVGVFDVDTFGKLKDIGRFDAPFFNFTEDEANQCAPDVRIMLEVAWETVVDSGYDPAELANTPTGVYIGNCIVEAGEALTNNVNTITATGFLNSMHTSLPNKVSEYFKFSGPSETHDTGCSASLYALDTAVMAMKRGDISSALIGGCNLNLKPQATVALHRMNMVSKNRGCRVYDKSADGYSRAECISLVLLQWRSQARRVYGRIVNSVTNNDGFKEEGIIFPDCHSQISLLEDAYRGTCVSECDVAYVEAHGTGTQAGDTQECYAVDTFFCSKRDKEKPLLIGSIKSNLGHAEPASGVASLCKVLLSYTKGIIPPNIDPVEINPKLTAIVEGRLKVVTEATPIKGNALVSLNAFGFGGSNAHVILLPNEDETESEKVNVFYVSGRTAVAVESMLELAKKEPKQGLQDLLKGLSSISRDLYPSRGYVVLSNIGHQVVEQGIGTTSSSKKQVWLLVGGLGSQWVGMGRGLLKFEVFRVGIECCQNVLDGLGADLNISHILCDENPDILDDVVSMFVGLSAFVVGLVDLLRLAGLQIDGAIGHSLGDTLCGYVLGLHTVGDVMKSAYKRAMLLRRHDDLAGSMYGVNCSAEELHSCRGDVCPNMEAASPNMGIKAASPNMGIKAVGCDREVHVACYNSLSHVTIAVSGSDEEEAKFTGLTNKGYKIRKVASGRFAFHTPVFQTIRAEVIDAMGFIGTKSRPNSWISTSYSPSQQPELIGPGFFADNLANPVFFQQNISNIPQDSVIIELSGNSSLLGLIGQTCEKVGLVRYNRDAEQTVLSGIGKLYTAGVLHSPYSLFPKPSYPTPRDIPSISSSVARGWNHSHRWWVPAINDFLISSNEVKMNKFVSTYEIGEMKSTNALSTFLKNYSIQGRRILPLSVGVFLVWKSFARANDVTQDNFSVHLTNVIIQKQIYLPECDVPFSISTGIMPTSGLFHVVIGEELFMTGTIETHDPLRECAAQFNSNSCRRIESSILLQYYELHSSSNSILSECDMLDYSCKMDTESCSFEDDSDESLLLILDSHFQILQVEKMSSAPSVAMSGASSIILDGRGFSETDWISKPYPGGCKSDAVWVEQAWFDLLGDMVATAEFGGVKCNKKHALTPYETSDVNSEGTDLMGVDNSLLTEEECSQTEGSYRLGTQKLTSEDDGAQGGDAIDKFTTLNFDNGGLILLYANFLGGTIRIGDKELTVTSIYPAMSGELHVCYAKCCLDDRCHDKYPTFAVGILSKFEILESSIADLAQHFFVVTREAFTIGWEQWAAVSVSLAILRALNLNQADSVLVMGDGDLLLDVFLSVVASRISEPRVVNTKEKYVDEVLFEADSVDVAVNLSADKRFLDIMTVTKRCGKALSLIRDNMPDDCGMSNFLKNISVINFKTAFVKDATYWSSLRIELKDWAQHQNTTTEFLGNPVLPFSVTGLSSPMLLKINVHANSQSYIETVFKAFFQHKPSFQLSFCILNCNCSNFLTPECSELSTREVTIYFALDPEQNFLIAENHSPVNLKLSPLSIKQWLWETFQSSNFVEASRLIFILPSFK